MHRAFPRHYLTRATRSVRERSNPAKTKHRQRSRQSHAERRDGRSAVAEPSAFHSINTQNNATWGYGINSVQTTIDQTTNRMYAPNDPNHSLIDYDAAGNQTNDYLSGNGQRTYDAENRMIAAQDNAGGWSYYTYDGDGKRVKTKTNDRPTIFVYGFDGELVAEYAMMVVLRQRYYNLAGEYGYRNGQLLVKATVGATTPSGGGGFETPDVSGPGYQYNPSNGGWSFAGNAGIAANNSAFTYGNPNAPEGNQVAFIQGGSSSVISQQIGGLVAGASYAVTFSAAQRGNCCGNGGEDFKVSLSDFDTGGGTYVMQTFRPDGTDYRDYTTTTFTSANGMPLVLSFVGLNSSGGDNMAFIDNVQVRIIDNVEWLATDQLGTPRMVFDKTGSLANTKRHDYLPFGEELFAGTGGRTTAEGYSQPDGIRFQFTSKERDNETGLDYFGARYYGSTQGRFTSPDPFSFWTLDRKKQQEYISNPQRWNKYVYVLNNPLSRIDPDGLADIPAWKDLSEELHKDLAKRLGKDAEKTWNSWDNDRRQNVLNFRAELMAIGAWARVCEISYGNLWKDNRGTYHYDRGDSKSPGWAFAFTVDSGGDHGRYTFFERADFKAGINLGHPENEDDYYRYQVDKPGDTGGITIHAGTWRFDAKDWIGAHYDRGYGGLTHPEHFSDWWNNTGPSPDTVSQALGKTSAGQYLRGISDSLDKLLVPPK
jgi:RHS repeat-associated protein